MGGGAAKEILSDSGTKLIMSEATVQAPYERSTG